MQRLKVTEWYGRGMNTTEVDNPQVEQTTALSGASRVFCCHFALPLCSSLCLNLLISYSIPASAVPFVADVHELRSCVSAITITPSRMKGSDEVFFVRCNKNTSTTGLSSSSSSVERMDGSKPHIHASKFKYLSRDDNNLQSSSLLTYLCTRM
jgi:hypothetical protein